MISGNSVSTKQPNLVEGGAVDASNSYYTYGAAYFDSHRERQSLYLRMPDIFKFKCSFLNLGQQSAFGNSLDFNVFNNDLINLSNTGQRHVRGPPYSEKVVAYIWQRRVDPSARR